MNGLTIGGRYRLGPIIGKGRISTVYRAVDTRLNLNTVVKLLTDDRALSEDFGKNFPGLMKPYVLLEDERLVRVLDYGPSGNLPFIVLANFDRPNLAAQFGLNNPSGPNLAAPVPPALVAALAQGLAQALDYLHRQGLTHLEVKLSNAWQVGNTASLGDFFMAPLRDEINLIGMKKGYTTAAYIHTPCPEMFHSQPLTAASDQYGLGMLLYTLLAGVEPLPRPTTDEDFYRWVEAYKTNRIPDPRLFKPDLPASAVEVLLQGLALRPADRFPGCREFAEAFTRSLQKQPTAPPRPVTGPLKPAPLAPVSPPKTRHIGGYAVLEVLKTNSIPGELDLTLLGRQFSTGREVTLEYAGQSAELSPAAEAKFDALMQQIRAVEGPNPGRTVTTGR
jgi:serine/threonine kinase PknH